MRFMRSKIDIEEIYNAALKIFAEYGYKKTTVDDIAKELNMTKSNLYLYAANKKDLYEKTVRYALTNWQTHTLNEVLKETSAANQFFVLGRKAIDYLDEAHELRAILKRDPDIFPMFPTNDQYEIIHNGSVEMIRAILENGIRQKVFRPVNVENISTILFSIYKMFIIRIYVQNSGDKNTIRELFDEALDLATRGFFAVPS